MRVDELARDHELIAVGTVAGVIVAITSIALLRKPAAATPADVAAASAAAVSAAITKAGIATGAGNLSGSGVIGTGGGAVPGGAGTGDHSVTATPIAIALPAHTAAIALSAPTTIWSRTNAGYIGARKVAGAAGAIFPVDLVTVPHDPATGTGGTYYRLLAGANTGWLVSASDPSITRVV